MTIWFKNDFSSTPDCSTLSGVSLAYYDAQQCYNDGVGGTGSEAGDDRRQRCHDNGRLLAMSCDFETTSAGEKFKHVCRVCCRVVIAKSERLYAECPGRSSGPGTILKKLTTAIGIPPCGGCEKRAAAMDAAWEKLTGKES